MLCGLIHGVRVLIRTAEIRMVRGAYAELKWEQVEKLYVCTTGNR